MSRRRFLPALPLLVIALTGCTTPSPRFVSREDLRPTSTESEGLASYYAEEFHGRKTANGETYDMDSLTAAHRTLPFATRVRVINLLNGKSVIVRINDRGPFKDDRIIDLSRKAAILLGFFQDGTAPVRLEILP